MAKIKTRVKENPFFLCVFIILIQQNKMKLIQANILIFLFI